jgi:hypothetical protein
MIIVTKHFPVLDEKQGRNLISTVGPGQNGCGNKGRLVNQYTIVLLDPNLASKYMYTSP